MKMSEAQLDKPFRVVDNQWYNQFVFMRISDTHIKNLDTDDVGEINKYLGIEYIEDVFVLKDPVRLKRYYAKTTPGKNIGPTGISGQ